MFIALPQAEQDAYLDGIRKRRLAAVEAYKKSVALKQIAKDEKTRIQIDKAGEMMQKELAALEKALDRVEKRAATINGLRLMVENAA